MIIVTADSYAEQTDVQCGGKKRLSMSKFVVNLVTSMIERGEYPDVILYFKAIGQVVSRQRLIPEVRVQSQGMLYGKTKFKQRTSPVT